MKKGKIKSIAKDLDLLELLSDNKKEIGITEISRELYMGFSTIHRILTTLKYRGYIVQNHKHPNICLGLNYLFLVVKFKTRQI